MTPQEHAQAVAAAATLQLGQSKLGAKLAAHFAKHDICFQTYAQVAEEIGYPVDGEGKVSSAARESVGRKVRELAAQQIISHRRVMPGQTPRRAKRRAWNGTTENSLVWAVIREKCPLSGAQRRKARIEHERQLGAIERERRRKQREAEIAFFKRLSGDVTPAPEPTYRQAIDAIVATAMGAQDARAARRAARARAAGAVAGQVPTSTPAATGPPPIGPPR